MSELPARLADAVGDPQAFVVGALPRTLGLWSHKAGGISWSVKDGCWSLPEVAHSAAGEEALCFETPAGFGRRFTTRVLRLEEPPVDDVTVRTANDVLASWRQGGIVLDSASRLALASDSLAGVEPAYGVRALPLRTPTLPPATHTNCYFVGHEQALIVDPGSPYPDERVRLESAVRDFTAAHGPPSAIFLTHHHGDHVGGAAELRQQTGLPIWAHSETAERVTFAVDRHIEPGDRLGAWEALWTPGHAPGHLCLWNAQSRQLLAGDMIASVGTIVVEPTDGDMAQYVASLARLRDLNARIAYPAHGEHISKPTERFSGYLNHRLWREQRIADALTASAGSLTEVTKQAYTDVAPHILWLAERQTLAHLLKLAAEGLAVEDSGGWRSG